jgi:hypothetical protein
MTTSDFRGDCLSELGVLCPAPGQFAPKLSQRLRVLGVCLTALLSAVACSSNTEQKTMPSVQVAMDQSLAPIYDDGELTLYEVRIGTQLPILAPSPTQRAAVDGEPMDPYGHAPWVRLDEVRVQLSWTLTNLDDQPHTVEVLVDPWNEFAKYFPGLQLIDADRGTYLPNLSGIDYLYAMDAAGTGEASRRHGTFTFDDLDEMARDFATAMNLKAMPPAPLGDAPPGSDATVAFVNHAFAFQNHSDHDLLVAPWIPPVIPGLTGFDVALRTFEKAKVAIEVVAEVVDTGSHKVKTEGRSGILLDAPTEVITIGTTAP